MKDIRGQLRRDRRRARLPMIVLVLALGAVSPLQAGPPPARSYAPLVVADVVADHEDHGRLLALGLDVVGHEEEGSVEVFLHGPSDVALLESTGLPWTEVDYSAQAAQMERLRRQEAQRQERLASDPSLASTLPTGRVAYRTVDDHPAEMKQLAAMYPERVKLIQLPLPSLLGRPVYGVEISRDVHVESGKPVFLISGLHHAREWPVGELTMEFAWDVLANDGVDPRITRLMDTAKLIVVPVVNPDGFDISRRRVHEQKRKNCRITAGQTPTAEECAAATAANAGVDLNRNYGAFWSGPGSSATATAENFYGEAPYSEPEVRNIVELTRSHQVTVAIHNHTPDGRLLRAPSSPEEPIPADVVPYDALAQKLGKALDWPAGPWPEIYYEASGVAEQHAYYSAGIFGFTTEAAPDHTGLNRFHPPYQFVVDQYAGTGTYAGSSMREAFLLAWEAAADPALHSVITGTAPPGTQLRIHKLVSVDTSCALHPLYDLARDGVGTVCRTGASGVKPVTTTTTTLDSSMTVPSDGRFEWHVGPSVRPSQYASTHLDEKWTLACMGPGGAAARQVDVRVERGKTASVDLSDCPG